MAIIIDIKTDRDQPKIGDEVDIAYKYCGEDTLAITKKDDMRCWLRIKLTQPEELYLAQKILTL